MYMSSKTELPSALLLTWNATRKPLSTLTKPCWLHLAAKISNHHHLFLPFYATKTTSRRSKTDMKKDTVSLTSLLPSTHNKTESTGLVTGVTRTRSISTNTASLHARMGSVQSWIMQGVVVYVCVCGGGTIINVGHCAHMSLFLFKPNVGGSWIIKNHYTDLYELWIAVSHNPTVRWFIHQEKVWRCFALFSFKILDKLLPNYSLVNSSIENFGQDLSKSKTNPKHSTLQCKHTIQSRGKQRVEFTEGILRGSARR